MPEKSARKKNVVSAMETNRVLVLTAHGVVKKYGLATPRMIEPGQKESVVLLVRVQCLSRQFHSRACCGVATEGVIHGAGRAPFAGSSGVWLRTSCRYFAAPSSELMEVGGVWICW